MWSIGCRIDQEVAQKAGRGRVGGELMREAAVPGEAI
jgi:hypothetical protein